MKSSMNRDELHEMMEGLSTELGRAESVDEESRELLRGLMEEIGRLLEQPKPPEEDPPRTLSGSLVQAARKFETEHPQLATLIGQLAETLNKAGI
jgi:hypothetical protein